MAADLDVWIDRGGTFTDGVAVVAKTGEVRVIKVLSGDGAPARAIRGLAGLGPSAPLPSCRIRMGTTLATNALLERKGSTVGMLLPAGLGDLLRIGDQARSDLFDLRAGRPAPLTDLVEVVSARVDAAGRELAAVDPSEVRDALARLRARGAEAVVVALLHAHRFPEHERRIGTLAAEAGFFVVCSHEVSAEAGLLARAQTALVDAYLTPGLRRHMQALAREATPSSLELLTSAGQLVPHDALRGRDAVLSGPAGGAVACRRVAEQAGEPEALGFDMGGTSTDVCRVSERGFERRREAMLAGVRVRAPMVAVHTVAAGGGSLCRFDGQRLAVGPESAGAVPGPLAYGRAEAREPTLTDVAVVLGRVRGDRFPIPLDEARAREGIAALAARAGLAPEACARGLFAIAVEHMAGAIATVSTARGHDPRTHALVLFGGAAGQWGCAVARRLGVRRLLAHPLAGVLSAFGIGLAPRGRFAEAPCLGPLDAEHAVRAEHAFAALETEVRGELETDAQAERWMALRYVGSEAGLDVRFEADVDVLRMRFEEAHARRFGYVRREHAIELVRARVQLESRAPEVVLPTSPAPSGRPRGRATLEGTEVDLWWREDLPFETPLEGPLLVLEATGTLAVDSGFVLVRRRDDLIVLDDLETSQLLRGSVARPRPTGHEAPTGPTPSSRAACDDWPSASSQTHASGSAGDHDLDADPVRLEVFAYAFTAIAERMGVVLQRTALSTNVRDRLDFSCAVFDVTGALVANAPHIPVHLGAMGASVRAVARAWPNLAPGDVFATNDPSEGGSHLPDITVVAPVHDADGTLWAFVAARGHHADVGGITPGSMPPTSTSLADEGVVLRALRVVHGDRFEQEAVREAFGAGPWPARRVDDNVADLEAQIAACRTGALALEELAARHGRPQVSAYMQYLQDAAARAVAEAVARLPSSEASFEDGLDDGTPIRVRLTRSDGRLHIDFAGTAGAHPGNLNAPRAVTAACVLYVLRCLLGRDLPLNEGCLRTVSIEIPEGSLLDPPPGRAVAGGNVETSQRVVDVLLGAFARLGLAVPAASQGTMNNLTLGHEGFGYYETLGGGAGAGPDFAGTSGVHTHMTNSRITDPEVLEMRAPVRVRRFELRRGSGGAGRFRGGEGLVRELVATRPLEVALLAERRRRAPYGLAGGGPGGVGRDVVVRADGREESFERVAHLDAGDAVRVETPGGGGYGAP
ncbi:MAG: hydantoinase B/oxoprolinase family protein [Myxococcota bacterium]|nr:hydantoinase B/oxoprolinase family protein [Myxococcota bacterium]